MSMSLFLSVPLILSLIYDENHLAFLLPAVLSFPLGFLLFELTESSAKLTLKEAFLIVSLGWFIASFIGAIPYLFYHFSFVDALFESTSGFTGTGASIIENLEVQPKSLLFWRSFEQWIGGMGIIVLFIAILPKLSVGGRQLFAAEAPGIDVEKVRPRIRDTAKILWKIYIFFSISLLIALIFEGMPFYDAFIHTFSTMGTGGFSSKNESIGFYSPLIQYTITLFMFIASTNFILHYKALRGRFGAYLRDEEFRFYLILGLISIIIITVSIFPEVGNLKEAIRLSSFQAISIMSATGFATADFDSWSWLPKLILFYLMFMGGSANSTAGGIKAVRILLILKYCLREIRKTIHPSAISSIRLNGRVVDEKIINTVVSFFLLYIFLFLTSSLILTSFGYDLITSFSASITCISNVGPGLGLVGPAENFAFLHPIAKLTLVFCMIAGRLELLPLLMILYPGFWKE